MECDYGPWWIWHKRKMRGWIQALEYDFETGLFIDGNVTMLVFASYVFLGLFGGLINPARQDFCRFGSTRFILSLALLCV
jgi:hypothetical protein